MEGFIGSLRKSLEHLTDKKNELLRKFIFLLLVGVCILVILWPVEEASERDTEDGATSDETASTEMSTSSENVSYADTLEERLENILADVKGVGSVEVMITLKDGGESVVLKDEVTSKSSSLDSSSESSSEQTVTNTNDGNETPYVSKELEPEIEGVIISCEGGGDSETAIKITEAVQALFDVPAHKIVILEKK